MEYRDLSLLHFRFHLEPKALLHMPPYNKGNVIRGGFGNTFRRIVCHANCREPETCELRNVCPYTAVFHPFVPESSEKISKNRDIPRPFVIKPPLETKETYAPGERLSFDLVVIGKAKDYLPYFVVTLKELSQIGLGRMRTPCELVSVDSILPNGETSAVYRRDDNLVRPPSKPICWADLVGHASQNGNGARMQRIKLKFLTPTTLKADGRVVRKPSFADILRRLRDRINGISYFYCGHGLDIDFKAFGAQADEICTVEDRIAWVNANRYSRRRDVTHDLSGFVGDIVFEGEMALFLPYLRVGEYIHVGKNAVFGNGWYKIIEMR